MNADEVIRRRDTIRTLVRTQRIGTQEELRQLLAERGFDTTQATLSRDLARLRARRITLAEGGMVYELEDAPLAASDDELVAMRDMVLAVLDGDALCVVQTKIGAAAAVAIAIDKARLPEVLGTIAGDDTIFVATSRGTPPAKLKKKLEAIWMIGRQKRHA